MINLVKMQQARIPSRNQLRGFAVALTMLLKTRRSSAASGVNPREKPVPRAELQRWWITDEELLWMLYRGHIEHILQVWGSSSDPGTRDAATTRFGEKSAFILTATGEDFADLFLASFFKTQVECIPFEEVEELMQMGRLVPQYDPKERRFSWGRHTLKQFRQTAGNQELILQTAEELSWPDWFDDPLGRGRKGNPKKRLHDAIQDLNRRQLSYLVHFKGDGTGTRIGWELR